MLLTTSGCREWHLHHVEKSLGTALRLMDAKQGQRAVKSFAERAMCVDLCRKTNKISKPILLYYLTWNVSRSPYTILKGGIPTLSASMLLTLVPEIMGYLEI